MRLVLEKLPYYWKAVLGFVSPGVVLLGAAVLESSRGGSAVTKEEWVEALVACVVTATAVAVKGNKED